MPQSMLPGLTCLPVVMVQQTEEDPVGDSDEEEGMARFDATVKDLVEISPIDWPVLAGLSPGGATLIDADISTVTAVADKVIRLRGNPDSLFHMEVQAGPDASVPRRVHLYNTLFHDRHELEVQSVVVLLRREANLKSLTGVYERRFPGKEPYLRFHYQVIRVWELSPEQLLAGGLGTLPLAPISNVTEAELPGVIERMKQRLGVRQVREQAPRLWTATYVLMGLKYQQVLINQLLKGIEAMEESSTYQYIVAKGRTEGAREEAKKLLLLFGEYRFGSPSESVRTELEQIQDLGRLDELGRRLVQVGSWQELLGGEGAKPRSSRGRRKKT